MVPKLVRRHLLQPALIGRAPTVVHAVHVRGHNEQLSVDLAGQELAGQVFVYYRLNPPERTIGARDPRRREPPPPAQITMVPWSSSQRMGRIRICDWRR